MATLISPHDIATLPRLLWISFRGTVGTVVGILGLLVSTAAWFIPGTGTVSLGLYVTTVILLLATVVVLVEATRIARKHAAHPLPRVRLSLKEDHPADVVRIILILEPSPMFSHGLITSIFLVEQDHYERFVGYGVVQNVQDDGLIQVQIEGFVAGFPDLLADLQASKSQTLTRLRVKPFVQQRGLIRISENAHGGNG